MTYLVQPQAAEGGLHRQKVAQGRGAANVGRVGGVPLHVPGVETRQPQHGPRPALLPSPSVLRGHTGAPQPTHLSPLDSLAARPSCPQRANWWADAGPRRLSTHSRGEAGLPAGCQPLPSLSLTPVAPSTHHWGDGWPPCHGPGCLRWLKGHTPRGRPPPAPQRPGALASPPQFQGWSPAAGLPL